LAAWAGWIGHLLTALWAIPLALVLSFIVVALRTGDETGLFMVGARSWSRPRHRRAGRPSPRAAPRNGA